MVSSFRIKFNTNGTYSRTIVKFGLTSLRTFGGFFHDLGEVIPTISNKIEEWEDFQLVLGPYSIEMNREVTDPTRFNLIGRVVETKIDASIQGRRLTLRAQQE